MKRQLPFPLPSTINSESKSSSWNQTHATSFSRLSNNTQNRSSTQPRDNSDCLPLNEDSDSLDLGLSTSLKRFKISTTPGELRLAKDMEMMKYRNWKAPTSSNLDSNQVVNVLISPDGSISIERDLVDPLRLRIRVPRCEFLIRIPRMYPHYPPEVYRITQCYNESTPRIDCASDKPTLFPSSRCIPPPPTNKNIALDFDSKQSLPRIIISNKYSSNTNSHTFERPQEDFVVFNKWTSISTLFDLILWLKDFPFHKQSSNMQQNDEQGISAIDSSRLPFQLHKPTPQCTGEESAQSQPPYYDHQTSDTYFHDIVTKSNKMDIDFKGTELNDKFLLKTNHPRDIVLDNSDNPKLNADALFQPNRFDVGFPKCTNDAERVTLAMDMDT